MKKMTREQVIEIVGRMDDERIVEIIETGAGTDELLEAFTRLSKPGDVGVETGRAETGVVTLLHEILSADEPEWTDREP